MESFNAVLSDHFEWVFPALMEVEDPLIRPLVDLAQMVEHWTENPGVDGSSPSVDTRDGDRVAGRYCDYSDPNGGLDRSQPRHLGH